MCASSGKTYMKPKDASQYVEIKANWGRARKQYGPKATDVMVRAQYNPRVDVSSNFLFSYTFIFTCDHQSLGLEMTLLLFLLLFFFFFLRTSLKVSISLKLLVIGT